MLQKTLISTAKYINFYYWEAFLLFPKALPDISDFFYCYYYFSIICFRVWKFSMIYLIFYQKLKEAERQRINKLEELDRKANVQLERQLVLASEWSRVLMTMCGRLKGTELDPENSHRIDFSDFWKLLNSNSVQYMEYSNYGQTVSGREFVLRCLWKFNF